LIVFDTYAWVEYFIGSDRGSTVREYLEKGEKVITPDVVLAEVARKYLKEGMDMAEIERRLYFIASKSDIESLDVELSLEAAKAWSELVVAAKKAKLSPPSLSDGIVLAIARKHRTKVLTGDLHFRGLKEVVML
jgi:predicted nucleic acid-binding protein